MLAVHRFISCFLTPGYSLCPDMIDWFYFLPVRNDCPLSHPRFYDLYNHSFDPRKFLDNVVRFQLSIRLLLPKMHYISFFIFILRDKYDCKLMASSSVKSRCSFWAFISSRFWEPKSIIEVAAKKKLSILRRRSKPWIAFTCSFNTSKVSLKKIPYSHGRRCIQKPIF